MGKTLIGQIGIVAVLTLLSKAGAFGKEVLLSYVYGAGVNTDAYFIANAIPGLVFAGFFATIGLVFLPAYTRTLIKKDDSAQTFVNNAILIYAAIALALTVFSIVFADYLVSLSAPGASSEVHNLAVKLTRILALGFVFSGWVGVQNAIQQSHKSFIWPITVPVINNLAVILGLIASIYYGGIILVAIFAILGWMFQAPLHGYLARGYYTFRPFTPLLKTRINELLILSTPVFFSVFLDQINIIIDLVLSSQFTDGAISHLSFAARLSLFLSGLFSLLVSHFIFPHLSTSLANKDIQSTKRVLGYGITIVMLLTLPLSIISIFLNRDIIEIVFQRGAFTAEDVDATAEILKYYAMGILFIAIREIFNRLFYSDQRTRVPLVIGFISAIINTASSIYLMRGMGVAGIAAGTSIGAAAFVILQFAYINRWDRRLIPDNLLVLLLIAAFAGAAMVYTIHWIGQYFASYSLIPQFIFTAGISGIIYAMIAFPAAYFLYKASAGKNQPGNQG